MACKKCGEALSDGYGVDAGGEHGSAGSIKDTEGKDNAGMDTAEPHSPEVQQLVDQLSRLVQRDVGKLLLEHLPLPPKAEEKVRAGTESEMFRRFRGARTTLAKAGNQRQSAATALAKAKAAHEKAEENYNHKATAEKEAESELATAKSEYFNTYPQEAAEEETREAEARTAEAAIRQQQAAADVEAEEHLRRQRREAEQIERDQQEGMAAEEAAAGDKAPHQRRGRPPGSTKDDAVQIGAGRRDRSRSPLDDGRAVDTLDPNTVLGQAAKNFESNKWGDEYSNSGGWNTPFADSQL